MIENEQAVCNFFEQNATVKIIFMYNFDISGTLIKLLELRGISESALGRAIDIPRATINRLVAGRTPNPRAATLQSIANYFDITVEQLLGQQPIPILNKDNSEPKTIRQPLIPIIDWKDAIKWKPIKSTQKINYGNYEHWVSADKNIKENMFALEVIGEAMWPQFQENTILFVDPERTPKNRDFVIYYLKKQKKAFFRQLFIDNKYKCLKPINTIFPVFQVEEDDILIGIVVQARNNYL